MINAKYFFISLSFLVTTSAFAEDFVATKNYSELIFRCKTPILSIDLAFEQGSEVYFDLYYNRILKKTSLVSRPAIGPDITLLTFDENRRSEVNIESSSALFVWDIDGEEILASLVYMGEFWGFHMDLKASIIKRDPSLNKYSEIELFCKEGLVFEDLFLNLSK